MKTTDNRVKHFKKVLTTINQVSPMPLTIKALNLIIAEMSAEKGFTRHNGDDYFVHPVAIAQTALDFQLASRRIREGNEYEADVLLSACLLHDALEDIEWVTDDYLIREFGVDVYENVDNVSKREGENTELYLERVGSSPISALVKILDRLNNLSTMGDSSLKHKQKQFIETTEYYYPLTKLYRQEYYEDSAFYWQARTIMKSLLTYIEDIINLNEQISQQGENNSN